jgi:hypothetical protein
MVSSARSMEMPSFGESKLLLGSEKFDAKPLLAAANNQDPETLAFHVLDIE